MDKTIHILLLEDNPADADLIEFELREAGINFTLKRVMTENDFARALKESLPDLILSDYDLPQYNGALALAETRKNCPDIPFILVTGAISEDRAIDTLTSGAKDYVMKSRLSRLAPAIRRVLKESEEISARKTAQEELRKAHKMLEGKVKKRTAKLREEIKERKKIEKALRENQFNTNTLLNSATESILMFGVNGDILAANDTAARRFNLTVSDVIGKKWTDFLPLDLAQSRQRIFEEVVHTGKPVDYEDEREGIIFHHHFYPARDTAGKIIGVASFSRDITENKKVEAAIKRMASFPILNPNPIIEVDMASQIIFANPAAEGLFPDLLKKGVEHPLLEGWAEIIRTFQQGGEKEFSSEMHIKGKWYLLEFSFVADTQSIRIYGLDITKRKIVEDALQKSEERFATTLASIGDAVIAADIDGNITFMNAVAEEITGWKLPEARLKPIGVVFNIINEQTRREEESPVKRVLETGRTVGLSSHTILVRNDKAEVAIANSAAPIKDQQGNITGVVLVFRDITEYRKKEANLHRLNRTLMALSNSNQALLHADDESAYMKEICRIIREDCGHAMVWIGFAEDNEDKSVRLMAYAGFEEGYLETLKITWADTERGRGPTGTAIRTGKPIGCGNMLTDPQFRPWLEEAKKRGYASSICLPLMSEGRAFGALTIYSAEPDAFQEDEIKLLSELATDLAYGITTLRLRVAHAKAEEALRESEERFKIIATNTPDHVLIQDENLRYVKVINPQLGYTEEDMLGKTDFEILTKEDAEEITKVKKQVIETGKSAYLSAPMKDLKGETQYFEGSYIPRRNANGGIDGLIGYFRNVTKQKKIEDTLRFLVECDKAPSREDFFERMASYLARSLDMDFVCIDRLQEGLLAAQTVAVYFDGKFEDNMSYTLADTPCGAVVDKKTCCFQRDVRLLFPKDAVLQDMKAEGYLGTILWSSQGQPIGLIALISRKPLTNPELATSILQLVGVRTATELERRQAEEALEDQAAKLQERTTQLEEINKELESFSYSVSHDLRAPLRAIDGYARMILKRQGDNFNEDTKERFNVIRSSTQMMGKMIDDLLSFSRLGRMEISMTILDMEGLIDDVWKEIQIINPDRKLVLKVNNIQRGCGDRSLIRQVYSNLLSNAVKYTKLNKEAGIETGSYKQDCEDIYYVKDNGIGFNMDYYDKLFGVFQRLHAADEYEGTGVGLAIVQRIIHRHGGRVWAESEEGKGATFYFTLLEKD